MSMAFPFLWKPNHPIIRYHCLRYLAFWAVLQVGGLLVEKSGNAARASVTQAMQGWDVGIRLPRPAIILNDMIIALGCAVVYCAYTFRRGQQRILLGNLGLSPLRLAGIMVTIALLLDAMTWRARM